MIKAYEAVATQGRKPDHAIQAGAFQEAVNVRGSQTASYIVALAKSKMLDDFGEHEAADKVIRPYVLDEPPHLSFDLSTT